MLLRHPLLRREGSGKSKDFYVRILGGRVIKPENPCYIKLANTWIILNSGGGPTPDKWLHHHHALQKGLRG
jgi:hypothetical protein